MQAWLVNKAVRATRGYQCRRRAHAAGERTATVIRAAKPRDVRITRNISVARKDCGPIVKLGVNYNVRFIVSSTGEEISPFFTRVIGKAEIGVAVAGVELEATEPVDQPNVEHAGDCVRSINGGSAVLQDIDVINQPERNRVQVDRITGKADRRQTASVLQDESFFGEKTAQVNFHAAVTAVDDVLIDCRSSSGWQLLDKVSGATDTESNDILFAVGIDRVRADFFLSRNV